MEIHNIYEFLEKNLKSKADLANFKSLLDSKEIINWRKFIKFHPSHHNRIKLLQNDVFEILLITWLPGQHTCLHSHPKNGCLLKVLHGKLFELRVDSNGCYSTNFVDANSNCSYMHDKYGQHIVSNIYKTPAISLHIYSPPNFYDRCCQD